VKLAPIFGEAPGRGVWVLRAGHGLDAAARETVRALVAKTLQR
jgi:hypothetical protein